MKSHSSRKKNEKFSSRQMEVRAASLSPPELVVEA